VIDKHIKYFVPLIKDFLREVESLPHPDIKGMPQPHFPIFGKSYESSALRMVIIGQDTLKWGDLRDFIAEEKLSPGCNLDDDFEEFREHAFTGWGNQRQTFWGFAMMLLSALHGQEDWGAMKQGKMQEILDSFAWANGNAVELFGSTAVGLGVPREYWEKVRAAGKRFNRFRHVVETLRPHVAVIMYRGIDLPDYFDGCRYEEVRRDGRLIHYHLPDCNVDVFHVPHPGSMNRIEGTDYFCSKLKELFAQHNLATPFPEFLSDQVEGEEVMRHLQHNAPLPSPTFDKFAFVAWVADELKKRNTFMSVPALCSMLNEQGYRTNYGDTYSGGRGSYRLVSGTYHRMMAAESSDRAHNVAVAFRRPNFEYAYSLDE
jgi:hypothetical protein